MSMLSRLFTTGLCLACAHAMMEQSAAQSPEQAPETASTDNWYQVHLAVFEHRGGSGEFEEQWRSQLQLTYPDKLIRLKNRERYLSDLCGTPVDSASAEGGNRLIAILEQVDGEDGDEPASHYWFQAVNPTHPDCRERRPDLFPENKTAAANARAESAVAEAESLVGESANEKGEDKPLAVDPPTPFILEDGTDQEFSEMVKKLRGAYRYRVLFADSWSQALKSRDAAPALLIQGGEEVGKHYQLEGYIKIALERYLHIDTNLWLSNFAELPQWARNEQQSQQLMFDEAATVSTRQNQPSGSQAEWQRSEAGLDGQGPGEPAAHRISEFPALPLPFPVNDPTHRQPGRPDQPAEAGQSSLRTDSENLPDAEQTRGGQWADRARELPAKPASNLDLLDAEDSSYYVKRTVVMRQNRRMRSGEVHYVDHPMFGLVVKITPLPARQEENNTHAD